MKKWLFFLHNFIEPKHYAIATGLKELMLAGVEYTVVAKRFLKNPLAEQFKELAKRTLEQITVHEPYWAAYDGLHAIYDGAPALALCSLADIYDISYILTFHGGYDTNAKIFHNDIREKTVRVANRAAAVTVVCEKDRDTLMSLGVREERIKVIPPPIDISVVPKYPSLGDPHRIAVVSRLVPKKGIEFAVRALALLPKDYKMDIVGDGELRTHLENLARELGVADRILWHGELPLHKMMNALEQDSILWCPSVVGKDGNADGIPQILLYGMACGRYIVASNCGHIGSVIQNGENGFLVPPKTPTALVEATLMHTFDWNRVIERAKKESQRYDKEVQKWIYKDLYQI